MKRRSFLQASGAASAALILGSEAVQAAKPPEIINEESFAWGPTWMSAVKEALGIEGEVETIILACHTGEFSEAIILRSNSHDIQVLPVKGIVKLKEALGLPHFAQDLNVTIPNDNWVFFSYQFAPKNVSVDAVIAALKEEAA